MADFFNQWIDRMLEALGLEGAMVLAATVPLAIFQGFLTLFPFPTLVFINIGALGLWGGLFASWASAIIAPIIVFWVCRYLFADWFNRRWLNKLKKYEKWQRYFEIYGMWAIILLRALPIMPNNLISFMAAISPIKLSAYVWSSIIGSLLHIWLFGIISSSVLLPGYDKSLLIVTYVIFCSCLVVIFVARHYNDLRGKKTDSAGETARPAEPPATE